MSENEPRFDEVADSAGAGGGVSQDLPAAREEREAAFAVTAQPSQELVVGPVVDGEGFAVGGPLDGSLDAVTCAFVSRNRPASAGAAAPPPSTGRRGCPDAGRRSGRAGALEMPATSRSAG